MSYCGDCYVLHEAFFICKLYFPPHSNPLFFPVSRCKVLKDLGGFIRWGQTAGERSLALQPVFHILPKPLSMIDTQKYLEAQICQDIFIAIRGFLCFHHTVSSHLKRQSRYYMEIIPFSRIKFDSNISTMNFILLPRTKRGSLFFGFCFLFSFPLPPYVIKGDRCES